MMTEASIRLAWVKITPHLKDHDILSHIIDWLRIILLQKGSRSWTLCEQNHC